MSLKNYRSYTIQLTANQEHEFTVVGNMYHVTSSSGDFSITFDDGQRIAGAGAGTGGKFPQNYTRVSLLSTTTQTVTLVLGFGDYTDARATVNATVNTTIAPSNTLNPASDVTIGAAATSIVAADANRKEIMIHVPSDAANSIRVGDSGVTAASGLEVEPGSTLVLATESAVFGIRDGAADVAVSVLSLARP